MADVQPDRARELAETEMSHDWCPECDGPGECQPETCCGRPYPELAEAERFLRDRIEQMAWHDDMTNDALKVLLADLSRLRRIETAARAVARIRGVGCAVPDVHFERAIDALTDALRPDPTEEKW